MNSELMDDIYEGRKKLFYVSIRRGSQIEYAWSLDETRAINYYQLLCNRYPNEDGYQYPLCTLGVYDPDYDPYLDTICDSNNEIHQYTSRHDKSYSIFLPCVEYHRQKLRCTGGHTLSEQVVDAFMVLCGARLEFFRDNYFKDSLRKMGYSSIIPLTNTEYATNLDIIKWFVRTNMEYLEDIGDRLNNQHMYIKEE